ncbi:unnamed protein product [Acanthoscelides obtectus]|uniref:PiggyBac transposable element-derived protein domain-containing protein n=1 Tax=Acanthoscelides obtectus TaxID=200917 RepID=A0A9P0MJ55_ACAOB|nr:unnamed protein product [Acanthoscelides obtectus]CAK1652204.1 PiggyBac transposable element-derived protein 4 [Acanthoscelides obtectus]
MSNRPLTQKELEELVNTIWDSDSDESFIEPCPGSDSDSYQPSDSSETDSDDDIGDLSRASKRKQRLRIPSCNGASTSRAPESVTQTNQNEPEAESLGKSASSEMPAPVPTVSTYDNNRAIAGDKFAKIKPLLDKLLKNYKDLYTPEEYVCVDETMLPYRGRLSIKQYIKSKRHKYGIKLFKLCSGTGYTYNIKIYAGKESGERITPEGIVTFLTQDIIGLGRTLVTDNWYTSLPLAKRMLDSNTHLIDTIRKNRKGLPKEVVDKKLKKGEVAAMENKDGITLLKWKDQRDVLVLSTKHDAEMVERSNNRIPKVVFDYNSGKSSVDLSDQMGSYSNPLRRSVKWYRKIAFELLLTTSMVNAFILYKNVTGCNIKITHFKKEVIRYLINTANNENIDHELPTKRRRHHSLKRKDGENKHKTRRCCKHCYKKNNELHGGKYATNRTLKVDTYCEDCEGKPFLCLNCFNEIHQG